MGEDLTTIHNKYKILTIGESHVGKTSILQSLAGSPFNIPMSTIGIDVVKKHLNINDKQILLQIWDTAGQERYESITRTFYRDADAILLVFDLTDLRSFHSVDKWFNKILKETNLEDSNNKNIIPIYLIGNKYDLINHEIENTKIEMFEEKAKELGVEFYLTSAKTGLNVNEIFLNITKELLETKQTETTEYIELKTGRKKKWFCF